MRVFVYGTLMRTGANHGVLRRLGGRFVAEAATCEPRTLVDLGPYPALLARDDDDVAPVSGEVWEIDASAIGELDAFEGCPDLYRRERVRVASEGGQEEPFVYVLAGDPPEHARVIASGRYEATGVVLPRGAARDQISGS